MECAGCEDFACCRSIRSVLQVSSEKEVVQSWLKAHGFGTKPQCRVCLTDLKPNKLKCYKGDHAKKGLVVPPLGPMFDERGSMDIPRKVRTWLMRAQGAPHGLILQEALWSKPICLTAVVQEMERVFHFERKINPPRWKTVQVDETYIGKRKYNKGHAVRKVNFWFLTATGIDRESGEVLGTYWEAHQHRAKAQFVRPLSKR